MILWTCFNNKAHRIKIWGFTNNHATSQTKQSSFWSGHLDLKNAPCGHSTKVQLIHCMIKSILWYIKQFLTLPKWAKKCTSYPGGKSHMSRVSNPTFWSRRRNNIHLTTIESFIVSTRMKGFIVLICFAGPKKFTNALQWSDCITLSAWSFTDCVISLLNAVNGLTFCKRINVVPLEFGQKEL